jgi:hypothetical protein
MPSTKYTTRRVIMHSMHSCNAGILQHIGPQFKAVYQQIMTLTTLCIACHTPDQYCNSVSVWLHQTTAKQSAPAQRLREQTQPVMTALQCHVHNYIKLAITGS